jgi:hypothetical protein
MDTIWKSKKIENKKKLKNVTAVCPSLIETNFIQQNM